MNLSAIRMRVDRGPTARPSADGRFYSDFAQCLADRADLLAALDERPDLTANELSDLRAFLDDAITDQEYKLTLPDYEESDKEWMKVRLARAERLMERLNNL